MPPKRQRALPVTPSPLSKRIKEFLNQMPYLVRSIQLVWHTARWWTVIWFVLLILQGVLPVASVYLTKALVDGLVVVVESGGGWAALQPILPVVAAMAIVLLLTEVLRSVGTWVRTAQSELVQDHIQDLIHDKAMALDLAFYDSADYYDQLHRARVDAINRPLALMENLGNLLQSGITLVLMAAVLLTYGVWLPLLLLAGTLPSLFVVMRHTIYFHNWRIKNTLTVRRTRYYDWMLTQREAAPELRLFGLGASFRATFQRLRERLRHERVTLARNEALAQIAAGLFGLLAMAAGLLWMALQAVRGLATLGDLALFYQAFNQGQRMMRTLLSSTGEVYRNIMFLENLFDFLALEPNIVDPDEPVQFSGNLQHGIRLQDVTFSYPGSQHPVFQDFNLAIPAGQIVAIVGENGAGKSTLIKLLCRFYDPQGGSVNYDGIDLRNIAQDDLHRQITVLFQEPLKYHETANRNIAYGDFAAQPQPDQVVEAAKAAGAHDTIGRLPEGYETVLGMWFGGAELSVGQWQRVALARAFLRQASLVILDEPTSAMDSWAEADWLGRFRKLTAGRTALIITHRFTTAMQADIIHVMIDGRIIESGSHAELLALDGRYAQSWMQQAHPTLRLSSQNPTDNTLP